MPLLGLARYHTALPNRNSTSRPDVSEQGETHRISSRARRTIWKCAGFPFQWWFVESSRFWKLAYRRKPHKFNHPWNVSILQRKVRPFSFLIKPSKAWRTLTKKFNSRKFWLPKKKIFVQQISEPYLHDSTEQFTLQRRIKWVLHTPAKRNNIRWVDSASPLLYAYECRFPWSDTVITHRTVG